MKILSWNIGGGHIFKGKIETGLGYEEENINYFIDKIDSTKCDIIGLQESHTSFDGESSQSEIIASSLDYHFFNYPYDKSHIKKGELLSLVNLSKFHIINSRYELLPNPGLEIVRPNGDIWKTHDKGFLISEIDCEGLKINFVNGHLFPFHHFKRSFMEPEFNDLRKFISDLIITLKDAPTIVAVDLILMI